MRTSIGAPEVIGGRKIDRFVLVKPLGAGGMGEVWQASDPTLGRAVAIKLLRRGRAERLVREARAMARLDHPNVARVYDAGVDGGEAWIAMELAVGGSLRDWLATPRPWREVAQRFSAAARGLAAAHDAGLVHRDFKPDNVLVRADGGVAVADFGLAREGGADRVVPGDATSDAITADGARQVSGDAVTVAAPLTAVGSTLGTPAYMAPEQHLGRDVDARADQFAFCVALWEGVFGERPFVAAPGVDEALGVGLAISHGKRRRPPPGRAVPGWLRAVLDRGLAVDRDARFPSMHAVVVALERGLGRRRRALVIAPIVAGVALVVASGAAFVASRATPAPGPPPVLETRTLSAGDDAILEAPVFTPDGSAVLVATSRGGSSQIWSIAVRGAEAFPITEGPRAARAPRISGDWLYWQLERPDGARDLVRRPLGGTAAPELVLERVSRADAAGAALAWTDALAGVGRQPLVNVSIDGARRVIDLGDHGAHAIALSPDGRQLAVLGVDRRGVAALSVVGLDPETPTRLVGEPGLARAGLAWSGAGRILALRANGAARQLVEVTVADGRERVVASLPHASLLAVGPSGQLAFVDDVVDRDLWLHAPGAGLRRLTFLGDEDAQSPTWARGTDRLGYLVVKGDASELRVAAGPDLGILARRPLPVSEPYVVLSRDGRRVAYTARDGDQVQLRLADIEGAVSVVLAEDVAPDHLFATDFTPGDARVIFVRVPDDGGPTSIWDVAATGGPARQLVAEAGGGFLTEDGRAMIFARRGPGGPVSGTWIQALDPTGLPSGPPRPVPGDEPILSYRFLSDGELAGLTPRRLLGIDLATGTTRVLADLPVATVDPDRIAAHPSGRIVVALGVSRQSLRVIDRLPTP